MLIVIVGNFLNISIRFPSVPLTYHIISYFYFGISLAIDKAFVLEYLWPLAVKNFVRR